MSGAPSGHSRIWASSLAAGTGVALFGAVQVHTTYPLGAVGLRLSAADVLLPLVLVLCAVSCRQTGGQLFKPRTDLLLLAAASLWLFIAIAWGRISFGHWQSWALANRGAGWLVLVGLFVAAYVAASMRPVTFAARAILAFLAVFWFSCIASAILMVMLFYQHLGLTTVPEADANALEQTLGLVSGGSRFQGFVVNPNAFGCLAVTAISFQLPYIKARRLLPQSAHIAGLGLSLFALGWSFSRGAWLAVPVAIGFLAVIRRLDHSALAQAIAVALGLSAVFWLSFAFSNITEAVAHLDGTRAITGSPQSARARLIIAEQAFAIWRESPIFGAGVGAFLEAQTPDPEAPLTTIHNTYLWLLAEMGVVGLLLFAASFGAIFATALRAAGKPHLSDTAAGLGAALISFAVLGLTMDVLFQRHVWLLVGLGLAVCTQQAPRHVSPATAGDPPVRKQFDNH